MTTPKVDIRPDPALTTGPERTVSRWHRCRKWTPWGKPYRTGGFAAAFGTGGEVRQQRSCVICDKVQDRSCEVTP